MRADRLHGKAMAQRDMVTDLVQFCGWQFETGSVNAQSIAKGYEPSGFVKCEDVSDAIGETLCNVTSEVRERL